MRARQIPPLFAIFLAACPPPGRPAAVPSATPTCEAALLAIRAGDLASWRGLPRGCHDTDADRAWQAAHEAPGDGRLSGRPMAFREYHLAAQPQGVTLWLDAASRIVLVALEEPTLAGAPGAVAAALGPPESVLEPGVGYHADAEQRIWASRGVALFVREDASVARAVLFPPTTVDRYVRDLGARDRREYLPAR